MVRGKSVIEVAIVGDARKLIGATQDADKATGGLLTSVGKLSVAGIGIATVGDAIVQFGGDSLEKFDTFSDSFENLAGQIGKVDAQKIKDMAFNLTSIGLSADEVGTLAEKFASFATSAGVASPEIAALTPKLLDVAVAISAKTGKTIDEVITDIGNAANGSAKPLRDYGVQVDGNATASDRLNGILDQLVIKYGDAKSAMDDVNGAGDELSAKIDNLGVRFGENLAGPVHDFQLGLLYMADTVLPDLGSGFDTLGDKIGVWGRDALSPINLVADALGGLGDLINNVSRSLHSQFDARTVSESQVVRDLARFDERNGQGAP